VLARQLRGHLHCYWISFIQAVGAAAKDSQSGFKFAGRDITHNLLEIVLVRRKEK
jgi:hypothetical protein